MSFTKPLGWSFSQAERLADAKLLANFACGISEQRERKVVLLRECFMRVDGIGTNADHLCSGVSEGFKVVAE